MKKIIFFWIIFIGFLGVYHYDFEYPFMVEVTPECPGEIRVTDYPCYMLPNTVYIRWIGDSWVYLIPVNPANTFTVDSWIVKSNMDTTHK